MSTELKAEYKEVRFKCDPSKAPGHFFIITACNPDGITVSDEANQVADQSLKTEIARLEYKSFAVTGGSPDFSHTEPGYGISCTRNEGLSLARQFCQDALFEIKNEKVILISAMKDPVPDEEIGNWTDLCYAAN